MIRNNLVLALNEEYVDMDAPLKLKATDTLAVIPPLSGG
jgi:molybdopterin converting factor small subunit